MDVVQPGGRQELRERAALDTVRSVLAGLLGVAVLGSVATLVTYRADVVEARRQVRERAVQRGQLLAESLALHFDVLRTELQRLADRGFEELQARNSEVRAGIREDQLLFAGGVALVDPAGRPLWSDPPELLPADVSGHAWFQSVLATGRFAIDESFGDDSSRLAIALPVRDGTAFRGVLVGLVRGSDRLLPRLEPAGEQLFVLGSRDRVVLPLAEPDWTRAPDFPERIRGLERDGGETVWFVGDDERFAAAFPVRDTSLRVLSLQSEAAAVAPIRRRLNVQLAFLLLVQLAALGAFVLFLRRTWRAFLDAEARATEQEKLAALGSAASLIAHEAKNSLNGLKAATALLDAGGDPKLATKTISGQVDRLAHLARSLLSFARPQAIQPTDVSLAPLVRDTVAALEVLPEHSECEVRLELDAGLVVRTDALLLATAIDNVVRNAIEAAVAGKDLGRTGSPQVVVTLVRSGRDVVIGVEDNAGPAPVGLENRLGEPFFTTRSRGIGLGLAMTRRALEQLGGRLEFIRLEHGSRFVLRFPAVAEGAR